MDVSRLARIIVWLWPALNLVVVTLVLGPLSRWRQKHPRWFTHHQWKEEEEDDMVRDKARGRAIESPSEDLSNVESKSLIERFGRQMERTALWMVS